MVLREKLYTADDLWELAHRPENSAKRFVLIEGVIYEIPPTGWEHGSRTMRLGRLVGNHVDANDLGDVTAAETGFSLSGDGLNVLAPDIGFIAKNRIPDQLPQGYVPFAPDLAVEVVSPGNKPADIRAKVEKYLQYGTKLVWIVYPEQKKIDVYRPSDKGALVEFISEDGLLDGGDVLLGFSMLVREIFGA
jgi:Uma2 family endonuclease